ncbi:MAG: HD domain-containing protein [Clostridiales bacterium]|nr:HD domain-containing protein [Clostridiales bacterium]
MRILRAMRFSSQLGFQIEDKTSNYIHKLKYNLLDISPERIHMELDKLIMGDNVFSILTEYSDVIAVILPEIKDSIGFEQHSKYHRYNVWVHSALAVSRASQNREVRLAMLLHDSGKPACFTLDDKGFGHFINHAKLSAEFARKALKRLRYDNKTIEEVVLLIKYHSHVLESQKSIKRVMANLDEKTFFKLIDVQRADASAKKDFCLDKLEVLNNVEQIAREILAANECISLSSLSINGYDLLGMGFKGKEIGEILNHLLNDVINNRILNTKKALLEEVVLKYMNL